MDEGSITPFLPPYSRYEAPCLYMEYIDGMTANTRLDESGDVPNEVVRYLLWQLAKVSAEMMSKEVPAAILPGDASDEPTISSTEEFYHRKCKEREEQYGHANIPDSPSLASKFPALYELLAPDDYFCLFNENLGFNKIIVDENWKITAMIGLDCVRAVPWSWAIRPMYRSMVDVIPAIERHHGSDLRGPNERRLLLLAPEATSFPFYPEHSTSMSSARAVCRIRRC